MKILFSILSLSLLLSASRDPELGALKDIAEKSRAAYALAQEYAGASRDPRINSMTSRILGDHYVILDAITDISTLEPKKKPLRAPEAGDMDAYLEKQVSLHKDMLETIEASEDTVLKNMRSRIQQIFNIARGLEKEKQAQEETNL